MWWRFWALVDGDIRISDDWKTVSVYTQKAEAEDEKTGWTLKRYCFQGVKYERCGTGPTGPPPSPRQVVIQ